MLTTCKINFSQKILAVRALRTNMHDTRFRCKPATMANRNQIPFLSFQVLLFIIDTIDLVENCETLKMGRASIYDRWRIKKHGAKMAQVIRVLVSSSKLLNVQDTNAE